MEAAVDGPARELHRSILLELGRDWGAAGSSAGFQDGSRFLAATGVRL